eukprot:13663580-Alexandrium_andersonii.AAC.1
MSSAEAHEGDAIAGPPELDGPPALAALSQQLTIATAAWAAKQRNNRALAESAASRPSTPRGESEGE